MFVVAIVAGGSWKVQSRRKNQKTESKDTLSSSDPAIARAAATTTAAETTVERDEILVLGTMQ